MKLKVTTIATLLISTLMILWSLPAIAASNDDLNRLISTNSCSGCDVSGATLNETDLSKADLSRTDLSGVDLTKAILKGADLSHTNLQGSKLQSTDLSSTNLSGADLSNAQLISAILSNADLTGANLSNAELKGARFWGFAGFANLSSANLSGAKLKGVDLSKIKLSDANLTSADLSGSSLRDALLNGANLSNANLIQANMANARLNHANLKAAQLTGANLKKANLTGADLTGADLREINLTDAILTDALGLDPYAEQLAQKATTAANQEDYLGAIAYLQQIPSQTEYYEKAKSQILDFTEKQRIKEQQQRDTESDKQLQDAYVAADKGDYKRVLNLLKRISENTSACNTAQAKLPVYEAKLQESNAEQLIKDAEWWANSGNYLSAIDKLNKVLANTNSYTVAQQKIADYKQKQEERSKSIKTKSQNTPPEVMLAAIDKDHFGTTFPLSLYRFALNELGMRCSATDVQIASMSVEMTNMLRRKGKSFDNLSFLKQAIDATEDGLEGQCADLFALLATLIQVEPN